MMGKKKDNFLIISSQKDLARIPTVENEIVSGAVPPYLTIDWYLNTFRPFNPHYRNISFLFEVSYHLDATLLEQAMKYMLNHHDVLRSRFLQVKGEWQHIILEPGQVASSVTIVDLSSTCEAEHKATIETLAQEFQFSLNLSVGPLFQLIYIDLGSQIPGRLLFVIHHLIVDGYSMPILLDDFLTVYIQLSSGMPVHLPDKTASFKQWAIRLNEYTQQPERRRELHYWLSLPWDKVIPLPLDYTYIRQNDTISSSRSENIVLGAAETTLLLRGSATARIPFKDILLTALVRMLTRWTGSPLVFVSMANHSRVLFEDLDVLRTVGFFSLCQEGLVESHASWRFMDTLQTIKKQFDKVPSLGFSKEILSLSRDPYIIKAMQSLPKRQLLFNYLGRTPQANLPSAFQPAQEMTGSSYDPQDFRLILLYVGCFISNDQLYLTMEYSKNFYKSNTINMLLQYFLDALQEFIAELC